MLGAHEAFVDGTAEHRQQGVEVAAGVEDDDGLVIESQLLPGDDFEQLLEGADASGQGNGAVGESCHDLLALVHVRRLDEFRQSLVAPALLDHEAGDDSGHLASRLQGGIGTGGHQPHRAGTVHEPDVPAGEQPAQFGGALGIGGVNLCAGCAVDAYAA